MTALVARVTSRRQNRAALLAQPRQRFGFLRSLLIEVGLLALFGRVEPIVMDVVGEPETKGIAGVVEDDNVLLVRRRAPSTAPNLHGQDLRLRRLGVDQA